MNRERTLAGGIVVVVAAALLAAAVVPGAIADTPSATYAPATSASKR
ncbi:hypothetical protein [Haladaptatus sp. NG-SE-30]